jgi:hypothetical protein
MSCDIALGVVLQRTIAIASIENNEKVSENHSRIDYPSHHSLEERYRLDNGITNNWTGWRTDFATFLVDCTGFTPEETMNYDPYL